MATPCDPIEGVPDHPLKVEIAGSNPARVTLTSGSYVLPVADETCHALDDACLFVLHELVVERQANQSFADRLGNRTITWAPPESLTHLGRVQRQVVKHRQDVAEAQMPGAWITLS